MKIREWSGKFKNKSSHRFSKTALTWRSRPLYKASILFDQMQ